MRIGIFFRIAMSAAVRLVKQPVSSWMMPRIAMRARLQRGHGRVAARLRVAHEDRAVEIVGELRHAGGRAVVRARVGRRATPGIAASGNVGQRRIEVGDHLIVEGQG